MNPAALTLAYKYIALAMMLAHVNFFASNVGLNLDHPITETDARIGSHVSPPKTNDFGGSIMTDTHFFGFGWGHLANFHRNDFRSDSAAAIRERNTKLAQLPSLIDTNGAYQLARTWLAAMGVDITTLEAKYKLNIVQWHFFREGLTQNPTMLPVYQVEWRGSPFPTERRRREMPVVTLTILGTTKELVEFHLLDDSLFTRPGIKILNQAELLAISDTEFLGYTALQRSNLLARWPEAQRNNSAPTGPEK